MARNKQKFGDHKIKIITGATVRMMREAQGKTQGEIAKAAGLERTTIVNIEAGTQGTPLPTFIALALDKYHTETGHRLGG